MLKVPHFIRKRFENRSNHFNGTVANFIRPKEEVTFGLPEAPAAIKIDSSTPTSQQ